MDYGARILERKRLPGGYVWLKVAIWDDPARKSLEPDVVSDFRIALLNVPDHDVKLWRRMVVDGVKMLQRSDTLEWMDAAEYKTRFWDAETGTLSVQPATDTVTPAQQIEGAIDDVIGEFVARWRARGRQRKVSVRKDWEAMPGDAASLHPAVREMRAERGA